MATFELMGAFRRGRLRRLVDRLDAAAASDAAPPGPRLVGAEPAATGWWRMTRAFTEPGGELECTGRMNATRVARTARKARASLSQGCTVRLFVALDQHSVAHPAGAMKAAERVFGRVQRDLGGLAEPDQKPKLCGSVIELLLSPSDGPGLSGVREPRRPRPDSGEGSEDALPE